MSRVETARKRRYRPGVPKDEKRGGRSGRNVQRSILLSEEADEIVNAAVELRNKALRDAGSARKSNRNEVLDDLVRAHRDELLKKP